MTKKKVVIVGLGPGGATAGMILASKGYDVEVFEKQPVVGGRNASLSLGEFTFDVGPTFLMMDFILEEMFQLAGRKLSDYLDLIDLDPLYRLVFADGREFRLSRDQEKMKAELDRLFPGSYSNYRRYLERERLKFDKLLPCLQIPYMSPTDFLAWRFVRALPYLDAHLSLFSHLGKYFHHPDLKLSFTFQAKYLGMSPWNCPATFSIISYIEHGGGIRHPRGGLNQITKAMARVIEECGGTIHLNQPVREVIVQNGRAVGVLLENGETVKADDVIINADFAHAMTHLVKKDHLRRWTPEKLLKKQYSCSTFMLYLAVDKLYDIPHHSIMFASDYKKNVDEISESKILSEDPSVYVQNASITDPTLAPAGKSTIYVLVPVANNFSRIAWDEVKAAYREKVLDILETRAGLPGLRQHIIAETMISPRDWEDDYAVFKGATFNLGHNVSQMLLLRPHNKFEEFDHCYLVGGGTHPGSGLPTIYESARISCDLIMKRDKHK